MRLVGETAGGGDLSERIGSGNEQPQRPRHPRFRSVAGWGHAEGGRKSSTHRCRRQASGLRPIGDADRFFPETGGEEVGPILLGWNDTIRTEKKMHLGCTLPGGRDQRIWIMRREDWRQA